MPMDGMDDSTSTQFITAPKFEKNPHGFDSMHCYHREIQNPFHPHSASLGALHPQLDNFLDFDSVALQWNHENQLPLQMGFQDFGDLGSWELMLENAILPPPYDHLVVDEKPLKAMVDPFDYSNNATSDLSQVSNMIDWGHQSWTDHEHEDDNHSRTRIRHGDYIEEKKPGALELDEIRKYFELPINQAAKELKVGVTFLKRRCRELNIKRWPFRKLKSLYDLIENVKGMGLTNEVRMLEEERLLVQQLPDMKLTQRAKKLRQACFKAKNKKNKKSLIT